MGSCPKDSSVGRFGYITARDPSSLGAFLFMALIGLVIASLDNLFLSTEPFQFAISVAGVVIFADLTAWDTQRIKNAFFIRLDDVDRRKIAIIGALTLCLDFLHLFLMSLRFVGRRRE